MGISAELDRQVRTYSTGTTHRLGLARALLHEPAILLLDEPTRSLDPLAAADFRRLLKEDLVRRHGTTLLFASHTLSEVEEIADRVILLEEGRIIAFDSPRALCAKAGAATFADAITRLARHNGSQWTRSHEARARIAKDRGIFLRDFAIARGYRGALLLEMLEALFGVATFYYLSRFVESPELTKALPAGRQLLRVCAGWVRIFRLSQRIHDGIRLEHRGSAPEPDLEALLVTQTPLPVILAGSAVYPFTALALRTCVYLAWGALLFGFAPRAANWAGAVVILLASILAFAGLGILSASYTILFKRGNPAKWVVLGVSSLVGGMMYPVSVLPEPLRILARLIPVTYSLEGMRAALLSGAAWNQLWPSIAALLIFAVILIPASFVVFSWALRRTKITGTLTHIFSGATHKSCGLGAQPSCGGSAASTAPTVIHDFSPGFFRVAISQSPSPTRRAIVGKRLGPAKYLACGSARGTVEF